MTPLAAAVLLSVAGSLGGMLVAAALLLFPDGVRARLLPWLVSYAVGALLAVSLMALLPEALELRPPEQVFGTLLGAIFLFFVLERLVLWRHCHTHDCEVHGSAAPLVLIGDAVHNFIDGAMIGTAVLTSLPLAISTAVAVAAHEIPQEAGDFAILLHAGYSRTRALTLNVVSGVSAVAGAVLAVLVVDLVPAVRPLLLCVAAGSFLYIAMADLIPDLHSGRITGGAFRQLLVVALGIATILLL
ncbi:MAG TPA: ZIP family metal transporter [Vicinamibacterales bacterium]|nr:ZIP family metal transporter [Vicinamibacterales bacterium]